MAIPQFCHTFLGQPPASILSRAARISLDKGPEVTENKDVAARDRQIRVGPTAPWQSAADWCATHAMEEVQRSMVRRVGRGNHDGRRPIAHES